MSERYPESENGASQGGDERLTALLREWQGVEPRADFDAAVWRRIRTASVAEPGTLSFVSILRDRVLSQPVWATALAAAAAVVIGFLAGIVVPASHEGHAAGEPLLNAQTVAGSYLAMVSGETR